MCNTDSINYHPKNNITQFTVKLPNSISLDGSGWMCGISQIEFRNIGAIENTDTSDDILQIPTCIYIATDIIDYTYTGFGKVPILRRIPLFNTKKGDVFQGSTILKDCQRERGSGVITEVFNVVNYTPLRLSTFSDINLYLKGDKWSSIRISGIQRENEEVVQPSVYCVLHFIKHSNGKGKIRDY